MGQQLLDQAEFFRAGQISRMLEMRERVNLLREQRKDPSLKFRSTRFVARVLAIKSGKSDMTVWEAVKEEKSRARSRLHRLEVALKNAAAGEDWHAAGIPDKGWYPAGSWMCAQCGWYNYPKEKLCQNSCKEGGRCQGSFEKDFGGYVREPKSDHPKWRAPSRYMRTIRRSTEARRKLDVERE